MAAHSAKTARLAPEAVQINLASSRRGREETLLGGRLVLRTPYGLKPQDRLLLEAADAVPATRIVTLAMQNIVPALALAALRPDAQVTFFHFDLFHVRQAESYSGGHRLQNFQSICQADLPAIAEPPDLMLAEFRTDGEAGLTLELLHQAHDRLASGGKLLTVINNPRDTWLRHQLEKIFGNLTQVARDKHSIIYSVKRTGRAAEAEETALTQQAHFNKHIEVTFPQMRLEFETRYGTFASGDLDEGSRALLDVLTPPEPCHAILDLGCGWGGMGVLAAKKAGAERLVMIDSNARAVEMARRNAEHHGIAQVETRLEADVESVQSGALRDQFELVVTNPPYGAELRVMDLFITMAFRALKPGGEVWIVGKNNPRMVTKTEEIFGAAEVLRRRGYSIIKAVKKDLRRYE